MDERILNPLDYYKTEGCEKHSQCAQQLFDRLLKESGVDPAANQTVAEAYEGKVEECKNIKKSQKLYILWFLLAITLIVVGVMLFIFVEQSLLFIPMGIFLIILGSIWIGCKLRPAVKNYDALLRDAEEQANQLWEQAGEQIASLDRLFTPRDGLTLIEQTIPEFSFHDCFTKEHLALLRCYDFPEVADDTSSVVNTLAGTVYRNPFLFMSRLTYVMRDVPYEGSKTIYWEEEERQYVAKERTVTDSNGNEVTETYYVWETVTVEKSQRLTAKLTAPKPFFSTYSTLGYGHHAAPDLSFSRKPKHVQNKSAEWLDTELRFKKHAIQRKSRRAVMDGKSFTLMANENFDVLFGATDRNNEHQFRVLFSPLAQTNIEALLKDATLGGDEFSFHKHKKYNIISCKDEILNESPTHYHDYSVQQAKEQFLKYHQEYFRSVFGAFSPLLAIPGYQERPPVMSQPKVEDTGHFTVYEHEAVANHFPRELLVTPDCKTDAVMKTKLLSCTETADIVEVRSHGYAKLHRTTTYSMRGDDGKYHDVDVEWIEYLPRTKVTILSIEAASGQNLAGHGQRGTVYLHGLFAKIMEPNKEESK